MSILIVGMFSSASGQLYRIDSLKSVLVATVAEKSEVVLFDLAVACLNTGAGSALRCVERAMLYERDGVSITKLFRAKGIIMMRMNRHQEIAETIEPISLQRKTN